MGFFPCGMIAVVIIRTPNLTDCDLSSTIVLHVASTKLFLSTR